MLTIEILNKDDTLFKSIPITKEVSVYDGFNDEDKDRYKHQYIFIETKYDNILKTYCCEFEDVITNSSLMQIICLSKEYQTFINKISLRPNKIIVTDEIIYEDDSIML